jgi:hypothetical protein
LLQDAECIAGVLIGAIAGFALLLFLFGFFILTANMSVSTMAV